MYPASPCGWIFSFGPVNTPGFHTYRPVAAHSCCLATVRASGTTEHHSTRASGCDGRNQRLCRLIAGFDTGFCGGFRCFNGFCDGFHRFSGSVVVCLMVFRLLSTFLMPFCPRSSVLIGLRSCRTALAGSETATTSTKADSSCSMQIMGEVM